MRSRVPIWSPIPNIANVDWGTVRAAKERAARKFQCGHPTHESSCSVQRLTKPSEDPLVEEVLVGQLLRRTELSKVWHDVVDALRFCACRNSNPCSSMLQTKACMEVSQLLAIGFPLFGTVFEQRTAQACGTQRSLLLDQLCIPAFTQSFKVQI